jgi:hypothetical protein
MERLAANTPTILANVYFRKPHSAGYTVADFMELSRARGRLHHARTREQTMAEPMRIAAPGERPPAGLGVRGR